MSRQQGRNWQQWMSARSVATTIVLLLAFIYSAWLIKLTSPSSSDVRYSDHIPDFYLTQVIAAEFDAQGQLLHKLISPKIIHIPFEDTLLLRMPEITIYSEDNPPQAPWQITALHGKTINKNQQAWLWGSVVLHQSASDQNKITTILTSRLMVTPATSIAETHAPVTVVEPGLTVHSVGMRAYLKEKRVDLLSRAQGEYDVNEAGDNKP
jgi:lipopolysaccharide export system protein LptC